MIYTTENLYQKKIVLISLLESKGINDKQLFSKIINASKHSLNLIHAKHIKNVRFNDQKFIRHLINNKAFRHELTLNDRKSILITEIEKILVKRYSNNKSNKLFQEFVDYILDLLLKSKITWLNTDLYNLVKSEYKIISNINVIHETRKAGIKTMRKLKLVNELIDAIDHMNYMNTDQHSVYRKYWMFKSNTCVNPNEYNLLLYEYIESLIHDNKELKDLFDSLNIRNGIIENKLLYNKLLEIKQEFQETLYTINYGINYSDKDSTNNPNDLTHHLASSIMPFHESGALQLDDKEFNQLNINIIFFNKSNVKSIKAFKNGYFNHHKIDGQIKVLNEGENYSKSKKYSKSYFIEYQYIPSEKQIQSFKILLFNLKKSCINDANYFKKARHQRYNEVRYSYPYIHQKQNYKAFKDHCLEINPNDLNIKYSYVYPYASKYNELKNKFLSFISWNNNAYKDYYLRQKMDNNLANILYNLDLTRDITNYFHAKNQLHFNKHNLRLFLRSNLILIKNIYSSRFKAFLFSLFEEYNNRIYLFQKYGIDSLKEQINTFKITYSHKYPNKRSSNAIKLRKAIRMLKHQLPKRKQYLMALEIQRLTIANNIVKLDVNNVLIQKILLSNIELYLRKVIIRKIDQKRSLKELVLMACNNLKSLQINLVNECPVYVKQINEEYTKFDELLDDNDSFDVVYLEKECKINVIPLFKCMIAFDRYLKLSDLYNQILNLSIDNKKLKDYIYAEQIILSK